MHFLLFSEDWLLYKLHPEHKLVTSKPSERDGMTAHSRQLTFALLRSLQLTNERRGSASRASLNTSSHGQNPEPAYCTWDQLNIPFITHGEISGRKYWRKRNVIGLDRDDRIRAVSKCAPFLTLVVNTWEKLASPAHILLKNHTTPSTRRRVRKGRFRLPGAAPLFPDTEKSY